MNDAYASGPETGASHLKSQATQAAEELRSQAVSRAQQLREVAGDQATRFQETAGYHADHLLDVAETSWEEVKIKAQDMLQEGEAYVKENPGKSVLTAMGVGFVLGLLFRR